MTDFLSHPFFLLLAGTLISALVTYFSQRINRATFKPLFEKHAKNLKECERQHLQLLEEISADQVIILKASNGGKMPSVKNSWKITVIRCYESGDGAPKEVVSDWQSQEMESEYWQMIIDLLHENIMYFPPDRHVKSKRLGAAHELYGIGSFILTHYFYRKRFFIWGKTEIYFARWGYKRNNPLLSTATSAPPHIAIPIHNRRKKLAQFFMR